MSYVPGSEFGPTLDVELTFTNGQKGKDRIKSGTQAIIDAVVHDYQNNDLIVSYKIFDDAGKIYAQG